MPRTSCDIPGVGRTTVLEHDDIDAAIATLRASWQIGAPADTCLLITDAGATVSLRDIVPSIPRYAS